MGKALKLHRALLLLKKIPRGYVTTYGILARACNSSPHAIGQVMRRNPVPNECPCYKVVKSTGEIGGYAGKVKGMKILEKVKRLQKDGVVIKNGRIEEKYFWRF